MISAGIRRALHLRGAPARLFHTNSFNAKQAAFVFDIDGVLVRGSKALPHATEALTKITENHNPWMLLTNGGGKSEESRVQQLSAELNFDIPNKQFVQSHTPFKNFVSQYDRVLVIGGDGDTCRQVARGYGFTDVVTTYDIIAQNKSIWPFCRYTQHDLERYADPLAHFEGDNRIDAVFVFNDPRDFGTDLQIVVDILLSENGRLGTRKHMKNLRHHTQPSVPIYFSNNDLLWSNDYKIPRFGQGAFRVCVEALYKEITGAADLDSTIIGKPFAYTYDYAERVLRDLVLSGSLQDYEIYMVGDNPASDIAGANAYGWKSLLVRTGVFNDSDLEAGIVAYPTAICDNVLDAVNWGIKDAAAHRSNQ